MMSIAILWMALCFGTAWAAPNAYILNTNGGMDIFDTNTNTLLNRISSSEFSGPSSMAVNPDGTRVYVTENISGHLSVFDTLGKFVNSVPVNKNPQKVIVHPNGKRIYVSNKYTAPAVVTIVDADTNSVLSNTMNPPPCRGTPCSIFDISDMALSPDGSRLYAGVTYTNNVGGIVNAYQIVVFDTSSYQVVSTIDLSANGIIRSIVTRSDGTLYVSQTPNTLTP